MAARSTAVLALFVALMPCAAARAPVTNRAALSARPPAGSVQGLRHTFVVRGRSAGIVEESGPVAPPPPSAALLLPGPLWSFPDNGEGWVGRAVTLGDRGTQVFTQFDTAADRASLMSSFDQMPVVPVWAYPVTLTSTNASVHGADEVGLFAACHQVPVSGSGGPRVVTVRAYTSSSGAPLWSWSFPVATTGPSRAMVSRDGARIVAGMLEPLSATLHVAVFDHGSGLPTATWSRQVGTQMPVFVLSEDGSTLYVASNTSGYVLDAATGALRQLIVLMTSLTSQDISGDGGVLAIGGFNTVDVWERQPAGNYQRTWQGTWPGSIVCHRLDVSEDGSTLVCAFGYYDRNLRVRIEAIDVPTKATTMVDEATGGGAYQNIPSRVATSRDGRRFAVGLWGDEAGLVPELRLYRRDQDAPVATYDYPGSVYDLAISASGDRVVVGTKSVHANVLAGGGSVDLYSFEPQDFAARGTPSVGRKVDFDLWGPANSPARLLLSPEAAAAPTAFPGYGVLYLRRSLLTILPMPATDAQGWTTVAHQLPLAPAAIGTTLYFQGLTTSPRRFTRDWVQLTILP